MRSAGVYVGAPSGLGGLVDSSVRAVGTQPTYRFVGPEQYLHAMLVEAGCESLDVVQCHLTTADPRGARPQRLGGVLGLHLDRAQRGRHRRLRAAR